MDVGTAMSVAQTLFAALECSRLKEICSIAGYKSQLDQLRRTVVRIKAVLKDAESKQELSEQEQLYVEELKDAVYEADDIFDEFVTLAQRKQLTKGIKVRVFSLFTKFGTAYNMSQGVMKIKNRLDAIAYDKRFELSIDPKPIKNRRLETCSYVYEADIIGREADLEKIVGMLLNSSNVQQDVSFLSIVGIGGLGKTALAQLVYNDARVTTAFPLRLWTCVADEDQEVLDIKGVLGKILSSATGHMINNDGYTMDGLQIQLRKTLADKKFLLVLDDVWTEDPGSWHNLTHFLMGGQRGSWIVVTTRSHETARIIRDGFVHYLPGLSKENSWCLFRKVAFESHLLDVPEDFVKIGEDIVKECANVPLAIRVVGSLLYGQDKEKWVSIQKMGLANIKQSQNSIMSILKLSYHKLEFPLKSCFSYCAIFPKDYVIQKDTLISLWIALGYIPLYGPQSPEVVGEEYFSILLQRCFFQDVGKDEFGDIKSCKIHDLMHDLAQQGVGKEICTVKTMNGDVDKKVRHLSRIGNSKFSFINKSHIRSYLDANELQWTHHTQLVFRMDQVCADSLVGNWKYLRALDLRGFQIESLTSLIGELIHLRYLDLSFNKCLEVLPSSITKLCNLLTLKLRGCIKLKELPNDMWKLVKLRALDIYNCETLKYMPRDMGKLSCLQNLTRFVVGGSKKDVFDGLKDLKDLSELRGSLTIRIPFRKTIATSCKINNGGIIEGGCLGNKEHLTRVDFYFDITFNKEGVERSRVEYDEAVMEELQPLNSKLRSLAVYCYSGVRIPRWPREDNAAIFLPNLVRMEFIHCLNLEYLGKINLPRLKTLHIMVCKNLVAILECPALEYLELINFNERLKIIPISGSSSDDTGPKLRDITIDNVSWLNSLPMNPFHDGANLSILWDWQVESLGEAIEGFCSCSSSLKYLAITCCSNLKRVVCEGLEHLSALEYLELTDCTSLSESEQVEGVSFCQSLCTLKLMWLEQLKQVPNWIQYLTALQTLHIDDCKRVESMPSWMSKLTSLIDLQVTRCSERLYKRSQESSGEDWPHIQHIPHILITQGSE